MTCISISKMWLASNFHKVKILALTFFLYLISPLILIAIAGLVVYRCIIRISAKISRKDLDGMISPSTSLYASDELYGIPNRNHLYCILLKGKLSIDSLRNRMDSKIFSSSANKSASNSSKGLCSSNIYNERLRMYPVKFQRFMFWKLEEEFKLEDHVRIFEKANKDLDSNRVWTEQDLQEIRKNLIRKQWTRFRSPWEILLVPNYKTKDCGPREVKTVLCVRFHMCIGNEVDWMKLLLQILATGGSEPETVCVSPSPPFSLSPSIYPHSPTPTPTAFPITAATSIIEENRSKPISCNSSSLQASFDHNGIIGGVGPRFGAGASICSKRKTNFFLHTRSTCAKLLHKFLIPFRIPYDFAEQLLEECNNNKPQPHLNSHNSPNEWEVGEASLLKRDHVVTLDRFSVQHVKEIKNTLGVSFSTVLMSAFSSALRVTFMEAGWRLPSHMKVMLPLSFATSQENPTVISSEEGDTCAYGASTTFCWINLPTGVSSSRERLRCCEASLKKLKLQSSTVPSSTPIRLITNRLLLSLIGLLPFKYHWHYIRKRPWTGVLINLKGPNEVLNLCDHQIEDVIVSSASDSGFVLSFVSYADYLRISLVIDYRLLPNELMAKNLLKNIYAELVLLGIDGAAASGAIV